ncbi:hypothetical protein [Hoeflea poritis]|uniref:Uncharacterized protein n=1 Tax=Hoeflea poritis TaxID=2993659 RepID=A0ABT4VNF1_9HYPH|nr:hypothetical protein [Hoeflea poritis]MDA4846245.1 hypothetical protein [Hoeflea poritis]
MRVFWIRSPLGLLAVLLVLASCTSLPSAQLSTYLSVSKEAEEAGKAIYGALNKAVEFNKKRASGTQTVQCAANTSNPSCFNPVDFLPTPPVTDPDILARILALETIAAYNDTLVALNSGQTGAALSKKIDAYGSVAARFASVAGVASGGIALLLTDTTIASVGTIAGRLQTAQAQFAVRRSLAAQHSVINALITALIEDTPQVYQLYRTSQLIFARTRPGGPRGAEGQREFAKIKAMYDSLGAYVVLLSNMAESLDTLVEATEAGVTDPETLNLALDHALEVKAAAQVLEKTIRQLSD